MSDSPDDELERLRRENTLLRSRVARLEHEVRTMRPLVAEAKKLTMWDFTPYQVQPDDTWVAVDRDRATALLAALAGIDHWRPWHTRIEPRPDA